MSKLREYIEERLDEKYTELMRPQVADLFEKAHGILDTAQTQYGNQYYDGTRRSLEVVQKKVLKELLNFQNLFLVEEAFR